MAASSPLIAADELIDLLRDPTWVTDLRICDVRWYLTEPGRGRRDYDVGHIPDAIFIDVETVLAAREGPGRHPLPTPARFAADLGALGIGSQHRVIVYDDPGATLAAARLWWMLDDLGHRDVRLLDGGLAAWRAAGGPETAEVPTFPPTTMTLAPAWTRVVDRDALRGELGNVTLLDARAPERYRGEVEPVDPVPGHIPTAACAPIGRNLDATGSFLDPEALRARFAGLDAVEGDVVTSCGSGITACHNALAMRIAGLPDPLLYPGSYSDWSRAGEEIATGQEPGTRPG